LSATHQIFITPCIKQYPLNKCLNYMIFLKIILLQ